MSRATSLENIRSAIFDGAEDALDSYERHAGSWLKDAPESYMQACIFRELTRIGVPYVTLEYTPRHIISESGVKIDRRSIKMRDTQRFDIVGWYADGRPRFIVEVKKMSRGVRNCLDDISRMRPWIARSRAVLQAGYFLSYDEAKGSGAADRLETRLNNLASAAKISSYRIKIASQSYEEGWLWAFGLLEIKL